MLPGRPGARPGLGKPATQLRPGDLPYHRVSPPSGNGHGADLVEDPLAQRALHGDQASSWKGDLPGGLTILFCADVLRPDLEMTGLPCPGPPLARAAGRSPGPRRDSPLSAVRQLADARLRLEAVQAARPVDSFTVGGQSFTKAGKAGDPNGGSYTRAYDAAGAPP